MLSLLHKMGALEISVALAAIQFMFFYRDLFLIHLSTREKTSFILNTQHTAKSALTIM
jgi:hypothetical protein